MTAAPRVAPFSQRPTTPPTNFPSEAFSQAPSVATVGPAAVATLLPTVTSSSVYFPSSFPSQEPVTGHPTIQAQKTLTPTVKPRLPPSTHPTSKPTNTPTLMPSTNPTASPTRTLTGHPTVVVTRRPSRSPTGVPTRLATRLPTPKPTPGPSRRATAVPTLVPSSRPSNSPTEAPSVFPSKLPTMIPSAFPTRRPSRLPSKRPTITPSARPTERCNMPTAQRASIIQEYLAVTSGEQALNTSGTPQNLAMTWLIDLDSKYICPTDPSVIQRYVMAVFYYSTRGDRWRQCQAPTDFSSAKAIAAANSDCKLQAPGGSSRAWLTPDDECDWGGVACNNLTLMERIDISKTLVRIMCDRDRVKLTPCLPFCLCAS